MGQWYEDDVERFIRERALNEVLDGSQNIGVTLETPDGTALAQDSDIWRPRLLLFFEEDALIAVSGHRPELLNLGDSRFVLAAGLRVVALRNGYRRRRLDSGARLSDAVMVATLNDILEQSLVPNVVTAIAATDNLRSIALCERHGLETQVLHDLRHVRLTGGIRRAADP